MIQSIGIDFGTTNSVVALLHDDGTVTTARHAAGDHSSTCSAPSCASGPRKRAAARICVTPRGPRRSPPIWTIRWTAG